MQSAFEMASSWSWEPVRSFVDKSRLSPVRSDPRRRSTDLRPSVRLIRIAVAVG